MEFYSPKIKKVYIFQEEFFQVRKTKISYISLKKVLPTFLDNY